MCLMYSAPRILLSYLCEGKQFSSSVSRRERCAQAFRRRNAKLDACVYDNFLPPHANVCYANEIMNYFTYRVENFLLICHSNELGDAYQRRNRTNMTCSDAFQIE